MGTLRLLLVAERSGLGRCGRQARSSVRVGRHCRGIGLVLVPFVAAALNRILAPLVMLQEKGEERWLRSSSERS